MIPLISLNQPQFQRPEAPAALRQISCGFFAATLRSTAKFRAVELLRRISLSVFSTSGDAGFEVPAEQGATFAS
jgi:hypothetical protein